jgi:hypothetical protein
LIEAAQDPQEDTPDRYVLLLRARDLAVGAGDTAAALSAVGLLDRWFAVDSLRLEADALLTIGRGAQQPAAAVLAKLEAAAARALRDDRYDLAVALAAQGLVCARATGESALLAQATARVQQIEEGRAAYQDVVVARGLLDRRSDDARARLTVGRYLCLVKGNWDNGLKLLAASSDAALAALARKDLANPVDADAQALLADAWWDLAESQSGPAAKIEMRRRAAFWYRRALAGLSDEMDRVRVQKRLDLVPSTADAAADPADPSAAAGRPRENE